MNNTFKKYRVFFKKTLKSPISYVDCKNYKNAVMLYEGLKDLGMELVKIIHRETSFDEPMQVHLNSVCEVENRYKKGKSNE